MATTCIDCSAKVHPGLPRRCAKCKATYDANKPAKRPKGRPRGPEKVQVNFRMKEVVIDTVQDFKKKGKYSSQDAVIEHTILHAKECEKFQPGEGGEVWTKDGEVEQIDFSDL